MVPVPNDAFGGLARARHVQLIRVEPAQATLGISNDCCQGLADFMGDGLWDGD